MRRNVDRVQRRFAWCPTYCADVENFVWLERVFWVHRHSGTCGTYVSRDGYGYAVKLAAEWVLREKVLGRTL